ncbi:MAG: hypothetical protein KBT27_15700 [Prevotellaceae bacterium]|nr:hypothetical protein [Candidatus Faecinaster equi]
MNNYEELIDILNDVDFADCCEHCFLPCSGSGNCFVLKTADAIEQLVQEYNELDKAHDEMFLELCKVKKEKDEAISQICQGCDNCKHRDTTIGEPCISCSTYRVDSDFIHSKWEWRGVTDD